MTLTRALRWFGPVAVAAVVAGAVAPSPAAAQSDPVSLDVFIADTVVPAGSTSTAGVTIVTDRATTLTDLRFTFDLAGLAGVATISLDTISYDCVTSGTQMVCQAAFEDDEWFVDQAGLGIFDIEVAAVPGSSAGATGALGVVFEAAGATAGSYESTVTVGSPVDLSGGGSTAVSGAPGDTLSLPLTVHNAGPEPAHGVALRFFKEIVLRPQTLHSNCVYLDGGARGTLCTFDVVLEPGTTYALTEPLEIQVGPDAAAPSIGLVEATWLTLAEGTAWLADVARLGDTGTPGTGPELGLATADGGTPAPLPAGPLPAGDIDPENNWVFVDVTITGNNRPDFAAVGAEFSGDAGDTAEVEVGVANVGTATADASRVGEPVNLVRVTIPEGTTAIEVPDSCAPIRDGYDRENAGESGHAAYICDTGMVLLAGASELFSFVLRIDEVISDATGLVEVNQPPAPGETPSEDVNPANDTAEIVVNAGGGGGGLPITGAATGLVAVIGLLLVGLGGASILLVRSRRTRFVA